MESAEKSLTTYVIYSRVEDVRDVVPSFMREAYISARTSEIKLRAEISAPLAASHSNSQSKFGRPPSPAFAKFTCGATW